MFGAALATGGAATASLPSTRGAPGAFGCRAGSNASERRPLAAASAGAFTGAGCGLRRHGAAAGRRRALGAKRAEAIFGIVLHALELRLQHLVLVLQLLDRAGELPQRILDAVDAHADIGAVALRRLRGDCGSACCAGCLFAAIEQIVEEAAGGALLRRGGPASSNKDSAASAAMRVRERVI